MGLFDRLRGRRSVGGAGRDRRGTLDRASGSADLAHLEQFVATRRGVEGYVEPRTAVTETTILLVAADGEWTRRRIDACRGSVQRRGLRLSGPSPGCRAGRRTFPSLTSPAYQRSTHSDHPPTLVDRGSSGMFVAACCVICSNSFRTCRAHSVRRRGCRCGCADSD